LQDKVAARLVEPVEKLDPLEVFDAVKGLVPMGKELDLADWAVGRALAGTMDALDEGDVEVADQEETGVTGFSERDGNFARAESITCHGGSMV